MGKRSQQSVLKRAREQALREKRELKKAKKDARAADRRDGDNPQAEFAETDGELEQSEVSDAPVGDAQETALEQ